MRGDILIHDNDKMGPYVFFYNLPPGMATEDEPYRTCTPTKWCDDHCYAQKNNFLLQNVIDSHFERYHFSLGEDFAEQVVEFVKKRNKYARKYKVELIRLHVAGDFYSPEYVEKWTEIGETLLSVSPKTLLRTTTRRRDLKSEIRKLDSLENMIVRESLDDCIKRPTMDLPFTAPEYLDIAQEGEVHMCPDDCQKCGYFCWVDEGNVAVPLL
jgi:hypothetical protein